MNTLNVNKILLATTILLVLVLASFLGWQLWSRDDTYYAVLTLSGDLFFGKLHYFPSVHLTNVWTIQRDPQDQARSVNLIKFDQSVWGPEDVIYFNKKNIIWKTRLGADSQVLAQIKNPARPQLQQQAPVLPGNQPSLSQPPVNPNKK